MPPYEASNRKTRNNRPFYLRLSQTYQMERYVWYIVSRARARAVDLDLELNRDDIVSMLALRDIALALGLDAQAPSRGPPSSARVVCKERPG